MNEVTFLQELLEIYSPSGQESSLAHYLVDRMQELGFTARIDEVGNVIGELRPKDSSALLVFLGHMDTVPGFIPVRFEDGKLYGRGAVDAKGPLAAFVIAAARAAPSLRHTNVVIVGAVEEEADSKGARYIVDKLKPDYAIIGEPSGWDGITLGYKGSLHLDYRLLRPAKHNASDGPLAAEEAVSFWNRLAAWANEVNRGKSRRFEAFDLSLQQINSANDGLIQRVEMTLGARIPMGFDTQAFKERALGLCDGAELRFRSEEAPFQADKHNPLVRAFLRAIRSRDGIPRFKLKTGTSDMNVVGPVWCCPIVAYGPGDSLLDHTPHEYIEIAEYRRAIEVLTQVISGMVSAPKSS